MSIHFEELWEKCEKLHEEAESDSTQSILDELMMKINLYRVVDSQTELDQDERKKIKSRLCGEILLTITNLSLTDNINVFDALITAYQYRSVNIYSEKYK